jgi:hypothetical protein
LTRLYRSITATHGSTATHFLHGIADALDDRDRRHPHELAGTDLDNRHLAHGRDIWSYGSGVPGAPGQSRKCVPRMARLAADPVGERILDDDLVGRHVARRHGR